MNIVVYGTLRRGGRLAHSWKGFEEDVIPVTIPGVELYDNTAYPYAVRASNPSASTVGEMLVFSDEIALEVLRTFDFIEQEGLHYKRETVTVVDERNNSHEAFIYFAHPHWAKDLATDNIPKVPGNDWKTFKPYTFTNV